MSCYSLVILEVWAPYLGFAGMSRGGAAVFYVVFGWNLLLPESVCLARMPLWLDKAAGRGGGIFWSVSVAVSGLWASLAPKSGMCQAEGNPGAHHHVVPWVPRSLSACLLLLPLRVHLLFVPYNVQGFQLYLGGIGKSISIPYSWKWKSWLALILC